MIAPRRSGRKTMLVKTRLKINVAVSVLTAVVIVLVLLQTFARVNGAVQESNIAGAIITCAFERNTLRGDYLRTGSERAKKQWFAKHRQMGGLLKAASEKFRDAEEKKNIEALIKDNISTGRIFTALVENREKTRSDPESAALAREAENRLVSQMRMRVYDRTLYAVALVDGARERRDCALWLAAWAIACLSLAAAVAAVANSWTLSRAITERIERLRVGASTIGDGNLAYRIDTGDGDEFAELSRAFNAMTVRLSTSHLELES
jgi:methyl-accepting chemotaxis protein